MFRVFRPDARKFHRCIFLDDLLDLLDVRLVELRGLAVFENHEIYVFLYAHVSKTIPAKSQQEKHPT